MTRLPYRFNRNPRGSSRFSVSILICLLGATPGLAQPSPSAPREAPRGPQKLPANAEVTGSVKTKAADDEAVTLSPFTVNADKDRGFSATNAGTATRLGLDLRDLAAPYSVITRDFIDALNITNVQEASQWATNGGSVIDGNGADVFANSTMMNVRGVVLNAGQQRNFFLTGGTLDTYNTERIDYGRGPNAVLFNVGANTALGGGISSQSKKARVDREITDIGFTVGSWDYYRTTLDVNRPLTKRFALRANAVWFDRKGWRDHEFETTKGITLAGTYMITPKTEFRAEVSKDETARAIPIVPIFDSLSGWDGVTVFDGPITNSIYGGQTGTPGAPNSLGQTLTYNGEVQGVDRQGGTGSTPYYVWVPGESQVMNWQNFGTTRRGDATSRTPLYGNGQLWTRNGSTFLLPYGNSGTGSSTPGVFTSNGEVPLLYDDALPADRFQRVVANSKFRIPGKTFTLQPDAPVLKQTTADANFNLTHNFSDDLFLQIAGDTNKVHERIMNSVLGFRSASLDINKSLPNGQPNPHFLEPYTDANITWRHRYIDNSGLRANLAYIKDLGRWGHYTFNLTGGMTLREIHERNFNLSLATNTDPRKWQGGDDLIRIREYWYAADRPYGDEEVPASIYRSVWASDRNSYTTSTQTIQPRWVLSGWNDTKEETENAVLATAARYFQNKLIFTGGLRFDSFKNSRKDRPEFGDLPTTWDGTTLLYRPDAPSDWKTLTYIPLNADGTARTSTPVPAASRPRTGTNDNGVQARDPLYANDRFRNDYNNPVNTGSGTTSTLGLTYHLLSWVTAKANYGNSYVPPPTGAYELEGTFVTPQTGFAYDGRLTFEFFEKKLAVTAGYFFNRENHLRSDPPVKSPINSLYSRNSYTDSRPDSRNSLGLADLIGTDYVSRKNTGYEIEVAGSITRGWRLLASVGSGQIIDYDRWPLGRAYVVAHQAEFQQVLEAAGGMLDKSAKPAGAPHAPGIAVLDPALNPLTNPTVVNGADQQSAVNDYNNIWVQYENILNDKATVGIKRIRINAFTDYTIQTGRLRGLRGGLGVQWSDKNVAGYRSADTVANPNYNASLPISATNLPYMDDPSVDFTTPVWIKQPLNVVLTVGYSLRLKSGFRLIEGKQMDFQLRVNNLLNKQAVIWQDGGVVPRAPGGDLTIPYRVSVPYRPGSYQTPISFTFSTTLHL